MLTLYIINYANPDQSIGQKYIFHLHAKKIKVSFLQFFLSFNIGIRTVLTLWTVTLSSLFSVLDKYKFIYRKLRKQHKFETKKKLLLVKLAYFFIYKRKLISNLKNVANYFNIYLLNSKFTNFHVNSVHKNLKTHCLPRSFFFNPLWTIKDKQKILIVIKWYYDVKFH